MMDLPHVRHRMQAPRRQFTPSVIFVARRTGVKLGRQDCDETSIEQQLCSVNTAQTTAEHVKAQQRRLLLA